MKKYHKILLYLTFLILTAGQAAAWEQSFEGHNQDVSQSIFSGSGSVYQINDGSDYTYYPSGYSYVCNTSTTDPVYVNISAPWTGSLSFTHYMPDRGGGPYDMHIKFIDSSGAIYFDDDFSLPVALDLDLQRFSIVETNSRGGVDVYCDGSLIHSASYLTIAPYTGTMSISFRNTKIGSNAHSFDDFTTGFAIVACDSEADHTFGQYYSVGYSPGTDISWYTKITSPSGQTLLQNISGYGTNHIPSAFLVSEGTYYIQLFQHNNTTEKNYYFTTRPFSFNDHVPIQDPTAESSMILDKSEYSPGDTIKVWTYVPNFTPLSYTESGYKIAWRVYTDAYAGEDGEETKDVLCYDLTSEEQWGSLVLPDDAPAGVGKEVRLVNPDGQDVAIATYDVLTDYNPSVEWSQDTYELTDTAKLLISQAPIGSTITFRVYSQNTLMQETTLDVTSSTGSKLIHLADYTTGDKLLAILKNSDGYILDQDYATVRIGDYVVSGRVYDALTGAAVPGATVHIYTEDATTDEIGSYSLTARAGQWAVEITADGYNTYSGHVTIQDLISTRNF